MNLTTPSGATVGEELRRIWAEQDDDEDVT
jgi:hypothetical protein